MKRPARICYFGQYLSTYSRNRIVKNALEKNGYEAVEVNVRSRFPLRWYRLFKKSMREDFSLIWVPFPGHTDMPMAWLISRLKGVPVVFDAFLSVYDSNIKDRRLYPEKSIGAVWYYLIDWFACRLADLVILDTNAHIQYFRRVFGIPEHKMRRLPVGADQDYMHPPDNAQTAPVLFVVFFYGCFIPLHGVDCIIKAAWSIEQKGRNDIHFIIAGSGPLYHEMRELAQEISVKNVCFTGEFSYDELPGMISRSDLCLGIFGKTAKVQRVIPNKVYDALACGKAVITADTPAIRELFKSGKEIICIPAGDPQALAEAVCSLKEQPAYLSETAKAGYKAFLAKASLDVLVQETKNIVAAVCKETIDE